MSLPPGFVLDGAPAGPVYGPPPSRSKQRAEVRADRDQQLQEQTTASNLGDTAHDNATADRNNRLGNPQSLRKEFLALPEVKTYSTAAQQLAQALNTGAGPQADLALTYSFAKAMDPESVVRESEQNMVTGSQPWLQSAVEAAKKQFGMDGAGNYTPEARAALRQQIIRSVASRRPLYELSRRNFAENAQRNGIDPTEVTGPHVGEAYRQQARRYDEGRRAAGARVVPSNAGTGLGGMVGGMLKTQPKTAPAPKSANNRAGGIKFLGWED